MADEKSYGWAGKILRVNLTTGSITTESTAPYKEYIGGIGLANKIMYDEVPAGTDPLSEESKIVYAVGRCRFRRAAGRAVPPSASCPRSPLTIWSSTHTAAA